MSLSVCFLTRNDEASIGRAVRSVAGIADEVIVADTGSADRTAQVAAEGGARVHQVNWEDDFAAGRNHALGMASGDWVLWLNPDEELTPASREPIAKCMADGGAFGFLARVRDLARADRPDHGPETRDLRLFRNRPDARYLGRLHPAFPPALVDALKREGRYVGPSEILILRHAYQSVLDESKLRWATRLLELELRDRPGQLRYLIEYGRTLLLLNDPRGHAVLGEAAAQVDPARDAPSAPDSSVQVLLEYLLTTPPDRALGPLSRADAEALALRWFPTSPPLLWTIAGAAFRRNDFHKAAVLLEKLVRFGQGGGHDQSRGFDPTIIGPAATMNLGKCYLALGDLRNAEGCFAQLMANEEAREEAARNLDLVRTRQTSGPAS